ncbi:hypothetical protein EPC72_04155 [Helicobacter pylori]|nr:hypothetical protein EPC72_04155 [Helicobacter pylori]
MMCFYFMMCFILKLYFTTPPFPSFPMISNHFQITFIYFFQIPNFLSNSKIFKQTLSIRCL